MIISVLFEWLNSTFHFYMLKDTPVEELGVTEGCEVGTVAALLGHVFLAWPLGRTRAHILQDPPLF